MKEIPLTNVQHMVNQINNKSDFSYPVGAGRFVVVLQELHKSPNPSMKFLDAHIVLKKARAIVDKSHNEFIIGTKRSDSGEYLVARVIAFKKESNAEAFAKHHNKKSIDIYRL